MVSYYTQRTANRVMKTKMFNLKLKDKVPYSYTRKRAKITDIIKYLLKHQWKWVGLTARIKATDDQT